MKKKVLINLVFVLFILLVSCKENSVVTPEPTPEPPTPPPALTEQLIGKIYFHDNGPSSEYDIFGADLYIVPKASSSAFFNKKVSFSNGISTKQHILDIGTHTFDEVLIDDQRMHKVVVRNALSIDISKYDFELRDLENITNSKTDDFAVNVNENNQITYVSTPDVSDSANRQIIYMDLTDRVRHQLTPINGKFDGHNVDPMWKTDSIIYWSHNGKIYEVDIYKLNVSNSLIPEYNSNMYDPQYSPDRTMILFNTTIGGKKNSFLKNLSTKTIVSVLPDEKFKIYKDDNPTWVFSNIYLTGHTFLNRNDGRVYTYDRSSKDFKFITDESRDCRYVTPLDISGDTYLIYTDWTDQNKKSIWISNLDGTDQRDLYQTGGEVVFKILSLPIPENPEDMNIIVQEYAERFIH